MNTERLKQSDVCRKADPGKLVRIVVKGIRRGDPKGIEHFNKILDEFNPTRFCEPSGSNLIVYTLIDNPLKLYSRLTENGYVLVSSKVMDCTEYLGDKKNGHENPSPFIYSLLSGRSK